MAAKLILFSDLGFRGSVVIYTNNDNDLVINGLDFEFRSAIAVSANWELFTETNRSGDQVDLRVEGGVDFDGTYKDYVEWGGESAFHLKSIYHDA